MVCYGILSCYLAFTLCLESSFAFILKQKIQIAAILPKSEQRMFCMSRVQPAIEYGISVVHNRSLVSNLEFIVRYKDSSCDSKAAPIAAFNFYHHNEVDVFFGPVCDYSLAPVARYAPVWNLPVITTGGFAHNFGANKSTGDAEFPTLTRIGATFDSLVHAITNTIKEFKWKRVKLIYGRDGHGHIFENFCFLAGSAIIHDSQRYRTNGLDYDFFLYSKTHPIEEMLSHEVGIDFSSKFIFSLFILNFNNLKY